MTAESVDDERKARAGGSMIVYLATLPIPDSDLAMEMSARRHADSCVAVARSSGLFDALADGQLVAGDIAPALGLEAEMVHRMLLVLASLDITRRVGDDGFMFSETGAALFDPRSPFNAAPVFALADVAPSYRGIIEQGEDTWSVTEDAAHSVNDMWRNGTIDARSAARLVESMHAYILAPALSVARSGVFAASRSVLDLGGGSGTLCAAIAAHHPEVDVAMFDMPAVCDAAAAHLARYGCASRVARHRGGFFQTSWPEGADTHIFSNVLHNWPSADVRRLLALSHERLPPGGRVVVMEAFLNPSRTGPLRAVAQHLSMWMMLRAQQFTVGEMSALLIEAGFEAPKLVHRFRDYGVLEAYRP